MCSQIADFNHVFFLCLVNTLWAFNLKRLEIITNYYRPQALLEKKTVFNCDLSNFIKMSQFMVNMACYLKKN